MDNVDAMVYCENTCTLSSNFLLFFLCTKVDLDLKKEKLSAELVCLFENSREIDVAKFQAELESFFAVGAARIDLIATLLELDNQIGGDMFDIKVVEDTIKAINEASRSPGLHFCFNYNYNWSKLYSCFSCAGGFGCRFFVCLSMLLFLFIYFSFDLSFRKRWISKVV